MHRGQRTTPAIGPRGTKGRVGDPGLRGSGVAATPARAESSRPASLWWYAGESLATSGPGTDPTPTPLWLPRETARSHGGDEHSRPTPPTWPRLAGYSNSTCALPAAHERPALPATSRYGSHPPP